MKTKLTWIVTLGLTITLSNAYGFLGGGGIDSGGGKSVVCRDQQDKIISAKVFDLYEWEVLNQISIPIKEDSVENQINIIIDHLKVSGRKLGVIESYIKFISKTMTILPNGVGLVPVEDTGSVIAPKNCKFEQLANYLDNDERILVDGEIWSALDNTNKAALIIHEAIYKFHRLASGATDSIQSRKLVGFLFAGGLPEAYDNSPKISMICSTRAQDNEHPMNEYFKFWGYYTQDGNLIFQFDIFNGDFVFSKTTLYTDKIAPDFSNFTNQVTYSLRATSLINRLRSVILTFKPENGVVRAFIKASSGINPATREFFCEQVNQ